MIDLGKNFSNIPDILDKYENYLSMAEEFLPLKNKTLTQANKEQPEAYALFDRKKAELNAVCKQIEKEMYRVRSSLYKKYTENYSRELSDRLKDKYIDGEPLYLDVYSIYISVKEVHEKYESVVEALKARGFALKNLTELAVHEIYSMTI